MKNPKTSVECSIQKQWNHIGSVVKIVLRTKMQVSEKPIKNKELHSFND